MADAFRVVTVEAFVGGASEFVVSQPSSDSLILSSTSLVVQEALLGAFLTEGLVKVELEGTTTVIRRVNLFEAGPGRLFPPSTLRVSRISLPSHTPAGRGSGPIQLARAPSYSQFIPLFAHTRA